MTDTDYQTELDSIWRRLRPHLEWARGFTLAVLFSRHPAPIQVLKQRLQDLLSINTLPLRYFVLQQPEELDTTLAAILAARPLGDKRPPLWLELRLDGDSQRRAVWQLLARLNERRFLLERDVACPLILLLPAEFRLDVPSMLPDLWSIRSFTADLPTPVPIVPASRAENVPAPASLAASCELSAAELEWQRLWEHTTDKQRLSADAAFAALDAAIERTDYAAAGQVVEQMSPVLRRLANKPDASDAVRNFSIILDYTGDIDQALGRLEAARAAYAESLGFCRQLREALGDSPQALRDLSVSLDKIGDVDNALGLLEAARAAYAESLDLRRQLREALGDSPQALRDLSVSLDKIGDVDNALGLLEAARAAYAESLSLRRQ
ncbi:hypothetical protein CWO84_15450, partial [Methylomonas sp. Kb3]|uniref:tetratricopeptide repeat protein n=1 Tax=Methylomonas sp. Kb3 TaxID=1611544 RepID=UPI000CB61691